MKFLRDRKKSQRSNLPRADFRKLRFQRLEQRLCLDDDSTVNPVAHFNEDQAEYQTLLSGQVPDLAVQADAQTGDTGADTPAEVGQWGPLQQWPIEFISALMLPTGKVMGWDRLMNLRLWDPTTGQITIPSSPGYNIFCSGMSLLANGDVLVTGGHVDNLTGLPFASIYNPFEDTWTALPNMNAGRWYPSSTTLANGDVLILSGQTNDTGVDDPLPQVFDVTTNSWIDLDNALQSLPLYPRTFDAPNGQVFVAGPQPLSEYLDTTGGGLWTPVAARIDPDRDYGSAVMYAPGKVLYVGGGSPASNSAEIIDLNSPDPQWQEVSPMAFARRNCDATLLPDGEVLITGGNTGSGNYDGDPVEAAEIWNPATETFTTLASESDIRWYHSTALLLPNGQVLDGSGDNHLTEQVYSPPYLFEGAQPTISSAPGMVQYGDNFFVGTPDASTITNVRWIRLGTATHAENWDQYMQDATFTQTAGGLMVSAPPTPADSPPGYYMLFIMRGDVPSVAKFVQVSEVAPALSVNDISLTEGAAGTTTSATFTVSLPLSSDHTITVNYATADGTATAGKNYTAQTGVLTFAPGVTSQTVTVPVLGDGLADPNENFTLNLSSPVGAMLSKAQGTALVRGYAAVPVLDIQPVTLQAPSSGTTTANFVVTLSSPQTQPVTVAYTTMDGTATTGLDYVAQAGTLTFAPGVTQMTIPVTIVGSSLAEANNQFSLSLSSPVGATLDTSLAQCLIYHENNAPYISIPATATIVEPTNGGTASLSITATLSAPSDNTVTCGWQTLMTGTAVDGTNFVGQDGGLTFPPGVTSQTILVPILDDKLDTPNPTFSIELQASLINATYGNSATAVTIVNSDTTPGVTLADAQLTEGNTGTTPMVFTATLTAAVNQAVNVTYTTSAGTAKPGTDYIETTGVLTIPAGATTGTFSVPIYGDTTPESDENFNVTLSNPVGVSIVVGKAVGTILDNDGAPVPVAPGTLTATAAFGSAVLTWQAAPTATSYNIYRSTSPNGEGTVPIATGVTGTTFTDSGLVNGTPYYYRVTGVTAQSALLYEGPFSNETSVVPTSYAFPTFFTQQSYAFDTYSAPQSNLLSLNGDNIENIGYYGYNMQLTDGGTDQTDSVFTLNPVNVSRFTTQFTFQQTKSYNWDVPTGGGLTFTIQNTGATALGATGSGLGYAGIANSIAIPFNLLDDSGNTASLTGLFTGGATPTSASSVNLSGTGIDLHSGDLFNVAMSYDGTTLVVTITDTVTKAQATQSYTVNIPAAVGGNMAYVGFTAGTGQTTAQQTVESWDYTPAPAAPSNLQAGTANGTQVNLSWTNNDPNATGTIIERKTGANGTYAPLVTLSSPTATTYTDNSAGPNTTYYYRLQATDNGSTSVTSNEVTATTTAAVLSADLQATVTDGQTTAVDGTALSYTVVVSNLGPNTATGATILDALPASATWTASATGGASGFWGGAVGGINNTVTMPPGSTITYVIATTVPLNATGTLTDTATVTAPAGIIDPNLANNTATDSDTLLPPPANPQFDLQVTDTDGQTSVVAGSPLTYTIVVSNPGPNTAVGAAVADTLPAAATWTGSATGDASGFWGSGTGSIGNTVTMPPGSAITYIVQTTAPTTAPSTVSNTATVTAPAGSTDTNPANNTATDTDAVTIPGNPQADLQITDNVGQTPVIPGTDVSYTIVATNAGPSPVTGAVITDALPASATWTASASGGASGFWSGSFGSINNTVNMPVNSQITYVVNYVVSVAATGNLSNTATITAPSTITDANLANNVATDTETLAPPPANPVGDLQITVNDGQTNVVPGQALTYTIVASNAGPNTISGAVIADTLPASLTNVSYTATATGDAGGFWSAAGNINQPVTMPPGSTITYTVSATVAAGSTGSIVNTATITPPSQATDPNLANNTATDTDLLGPPADLQVTVNDGQTSAVPGSAIHYTIVVTNAGPNAATGATVADAFPAILTGVTYTATATGGATGFAASGTGNINGTVNMPSGSTITYVASATVSPTATGVLADTATVTPPTTVSDPNLANNTATDTDTLPSTTADLQITNTDGQTNVTPGTTVAYTIVVTNAGPSAVTGATVSDPLPSALTGATYTATATGGATGFTASGTGSVSDTVNMPSGSTITYVVSATLNPAAIGTLLNTATVAAPVGVTDPNTANNTAADTDTLTPQADLQITNTDGQTSATPGAAVTYTIVVTNAGPSSAIGAIVTDTLPAILTGATFTATATGGATGYSASGMGNISNTLTMPTGSTVTYVVSGTISSAATGTLTNTASVAPPPGTTDPNTVNNTSTDADTLAPRADLQITNTDGQTSATPGSAVAYTIVVTNAGPSAVTGATVADTLPATITGITYTATATGGATGFTASGSGNLSNTVSMPNGSTITYIVSGTISSTATGTLANTASVAAPSGTTDPNTANNTATDSDTLAPRADLQITNTDGQTSATPGATVAYTIVVTNAGPNSVTGATVSDTLPATITGVTYTATATGGATGFTASGSGNLSNTVSMPNGSTITYIVSGTISSTATGTLANTASVAAPSGTTDPNTANNTATDSDTLAPRADLQITNTDGQTSATAGSAITYTVVVTNAGPSAVTGATVTDTLPTTITGVTYTATATGAATGFTASGSGNLSNTVSMPTGSTITYVVHGTLSSTATGSLANTASVAAPSGTTDPNTANNTATDTDTISTSTSTDLQITMTDGQTTVVPGAAVTYKIVVTNAGPSPVTGATITDTLPATYSNVSFTATATGDAAGFWASAPGNLSNTVTMPVGSTITYLVTATVSPTATGNVSNTATVAVPAGITDTNTANNTATDTDTATAPQADLQLTMTDGKTTVVPGATNTYTIVVTNAGPSTATGATITDALPTTFTNVSFTATATGGASGFWASAPGNLSNTVTMPPGSTITYLVTATVSPTATGSVANTASVAAPTGTTDPNTANNTATDTDTIAAPQADLKVTLTDGQTTIVPGSVATYTIVVTNAGPSNATGVVIADSLPTSFSSISFTATATGGASGFWASATDNLSNTVNMPTGSTITYVLKGTLAATATGSVADTAALTVPSGLTDPNTANNTATDTDTVVAAVAATTPTSGATGVATTGSVTVTFAAAMNASTINTTTLVVFNAQNQPVTVTVTYNASTKTATIKPSAALAKNTTYTVEVLGGSTGVKDSDGNTMPANYLSTFTTGST